MRLNEISNSIINESLVVFTPAKPSKDIDSSDDVMTQHSVDPSGKLSHEYGGFAQVGDYELPISTKFAKAIMSALGRDYDDEGYIENQELDDFTKDIENALKKFDSASVDQELLKGKNPSKLRFFLQTLKSAVEEAKRIGSGFLWITA